MTGFELRISGIGSNRATNCATTSALLQIAECKRHIVHGLGYIFMK